MPSMMFALRVSVAFLVAFFSFPAQAQNAPRSQQDQKEWTVLVFLNGHNNLDSYGTRDMLEMEKVGSTDKVNVVVQWASLGFPNTRRVLVRKSTDPTRVISPAVQEIPRADMGDWRQLVEFVRWGVQNYPAKRYFIDVWNHGTGWRKSRPATIGAKDISFDDISGNAMSTVQLGAALRQAAQIIGHKVDLYGSDACLMSMAEIAHEVSDSVEIFAGSEEVEPAPGWPYDAVLERMNSMADPSAANVGKALAEVYTRSYQAGGSQGVQQTTFSIFDLSKMPELGSAIRSFGEGLRSVSGNERITLRNAARNSQRFTYGDYRDLIDFATLVERANLSSMRGNLIPNLRTAVSQFVISNHVSPAYSRASGLAIWLPGDLPTFNAYSTKYRQLRFVPATGWDEALRGFLQ